MAVTAGGTPYVESSDLVANYPGVSLSVANKIDTKANSASPLLTGTITLDNGAEDYTILRDSATGFLLINGLQTAFSGYRFRVNTGGTPKTLMTISNAGILTGVGSLGAWQSYTPAVAGTGWALGNGTATGSYLIIGQTLHFVAQITFGSTSTFGTAAGLTISIPFTADVTPQVATLTGQGVDTSLGNSYDLPVLMQSLTVAPYAFFSSVGELREVINSRPFTWANTDIVRVSGTYEVA